MIEIYSNLNFLSTSEDLSQFLYKFDLNNLDYKLLASLLSFSLFKLDKKESLTLSFYDANQSKVKFYKLVSTQSVVSLANSYVYSFKYTSDFEEAIESIRNISQPLSNIYFI